MSRAPSNTSLITRSARILGLLAACLAGCIENPGPDPLLGVPWPQNARTLAVFQEAGILELRLSRDSGRTRLAVFNASPEALDSASFHLEFTLNGNRPYYEFNDFASRNILLEYFGKVGPLASGASQDLGVLDTTERSALSGRYLAATLFSLHRNGANQGSPFAGAYRGSYILREALGKSTEGPLRGMINADGKIRFGLFASTDITDRRWLLTGLVRAGGKVGEAAREAVLWDNYLRREFDATGTLMPGEKGYSAAFNIHGSGTISKDSLDLVLDPHPAR